MTKRSPAFQFYPNDFLGGVVAAYSLEEIGLYTVLLSFDWNLSGLPLDAEKLAKLSRVSLRKFRALWAVVGENFTEHDGRYFNPRLQLERAKQEEWRRKSSEGGKKGGGKGGLRVVEPPYQPNGNTQSLTQSSTPVKELTAGADAPKPRARTLPPTWVAEGVAWWLPNVGTMSPARFQKVLGPVVALYSWERVFPDLQAWVADRAAERKPRKLEWYGEEASGRITTGALTAADLWDYDRGELSALGERLTRPAA